MPSICVTTDKDIVYTHHSIGVKVCRKTGYK
nr:MAG TPA: ABC transporter solute binding protein [Caudoviricetes sp.]DAT69752.1 MAG TPA: ABC transporter solute binding protein [Caudoviricetes sp.]